FVGDRLGAAGDRRGLVYGRRPAGVSPPEMAARGRAAAPVCCRSRPTPHPEPAMNRRRFLTSLAAAPAAVLLDRSHAPAALPTAKVTKVSIYEPPDLNPLFNQS